MPGYQLNALCPPFDVQAANTLPDQSGWVKGPDGVRAKGVDLAMHKKLVHNYMLGLEGLPKTTCSGCGGATGGIASRILPVSEEKSYS